MSTLPCGCTYHVQGHHTTPQPARTQTEVDSLEEALIDAQIAEAQAGQIQDDELAFIEASCEFCDKPKRGPREQTCGSDECLAKAYGGRR